MESTEKSPPFNKKEFVEPFTGNVHDRIYGAMPANPYLNDEVKNRQAKIDSELIKLFKYPPEKLNIPKDFRNFLLEDHNIGEERRKMQNFNSYAIWQQKIAGLQLPKYLTEKLSRFETGHAETDDILDIVMDPINDDKETTLESFEIGKLTHGYWKRIEHLSSFRESVQDSIASHGGVLFPTILPYRSIDILPKVVTDKQGHERIVGFIVKYKHDIGEITSENSERTINIVERQLAGYRVDEASGFRQDILDSMQAVSDFKAGSFSWENVHDKQFEYHLRNTGCRGFIEKAVQLDSTEAFVVPISTTIYGFSEFNAQTKKTEKVAFRKPDSDENIAFYKSGKTK
ncbi:MAG: hypothetical protein JWO54_456 [Candidatus Saccharibacteria bacterium]|nr:hypothetical protein [Candidatus Saccharibacteria bacterium]MDB5180696.1 hypothetical protein [Candidatus Saccharibacteria bacterium]